MAKVNVVGNAMVITSSVKLEDIEKVEKYRPNALVVMEKTAFSDEVEPVFKVATGAIESVNNHGICFADKSREGEYAQMTLAIVGGDPSTDELKQMISDKYGRALLYLEKVEKAIPDLVKEIDEEMGTIGKMIEIA